MLTSSLAIVVRATRTSDSGLVVDMLTERYGRMAFMVHVGRGRRQPSLSMFQCLSQVEVDFDLRSRSDIQHIRNVRMASAYGSIPFEASKMAVAMFLAEFLSHASRGEHEAGRLFDFVRKSLLWYDESAASAPNFHLVFMIGVLRFLGFRPDIRRDAAGEYFDLLSGEYCSARPAHSHYMSGDELRLMPLLLEADYNSMHNLVMSRQQRNRATDIVLDFCRIHLPQFPAMRSISIVRELF